MKVLVKAASSCHHSIKDLLSKVTNFSASKSKYLKSNSTLHDLYVHEPTVNRLSCG